MATEHTSAEPTVELASCKNIIHVHTLYDRRGVRQHHIVECMQLMDHVDRAVAAYQMKAVPELLMYISLWLSQCLTSFLA